MTSCRSVILIGVAAVLAAVVLWRWVAGWGLITVDFEAAPVGQVIHAIEKQGRIRIVTNAPPETTVTLRVRRAPLFEALDLLAVRMEADMRFGYVLAPDARTVQQGVALLSDSRRPEGWRTFSAGWGGGMMGDSVPDLRRISAKVVPTGDDRTLHAFLDQAAQKTGASIFVPEGWNPSLSSWPGEGVLGPQIARVAKSAKGQSREVVLLTVRGNRPEGPRSSEVAAGGMPGMGGARREGGQRRDGGPRGGGNPEWAQERALAQIALLPPEEQQQAKEELEDMQKFWAEVRALPPEQREQKIGEHMARPEVQDRIEERMASRDMKRTPSQRASRYKQYIERKQAAMAAQN